MNYDCSEDVLIKRLLERGNNFPLFIIDHILQGKNSGRVDDQSLETIKFRIQTFNEQTCPALNFYRNLGKVKNLSSEAEVDVVYKHTREALLPNVIFLYGPPSIGQKYVSEKLASHLHYTLINVSSFFESHGCQKDNDEVKVGHLVSYMKYHANRNFIIDNFPQTLKQFKIFTESFVNPLKIIYFDASKDIVEDIYKRSFPKNNERKALFEEYEQFSLLRKDILPIIQKKSYFHLVSAGQHLDELVKTLIKHVSPQVILAPFDFNDAFTTKYIDDLIALRGFKHVDLVKLIADEKARNTDLWKILGKSINLDDIHSSSEHVFQFIRKVLYSDPSSKKFIVTNVPNDNDFFEKFNQNCCNVNFALAFTHQQNFVLSLPTERHPIANFHSQGKLILVDSPSLNIVDNFIQSKCRFGIVIGPTLSGKTTVTNHLLGKYATEVLKFDEATEILKKKLSTEENPVEDVPFPEMIKYIKEKLNSLKKSDIFIIDGLPFTVDQLNLLFNNCGYPDFVINLSMSREIGIKRLKAKNESESDEGLDEPVQKSLDEANKTFKLFTHAIDNGNNITVYNVDVNVSMQDTLKDINKIIYKKVILARNLLLNNPKIDFGTIFTNYAIRNKVVMVNVPQLIQEGLNSDDAISNELQTQLKMNQYSGNQQSYSGSMFNPSLITKLIKKFLQSNPIESRYYFLILL